jgi:antitoxin ParD1/3/4
MSRAMPLNVRVTGSLGDFIAENVGQDGTYENVSEYVRHLIRKDKARVEDRKFQRLKAELTHAFAAADSTCESLADSNLSEDTLATWLAEHVAKALRELPTRS